MNSREKPMEQSSNSGNFDIRQTNITKGVAVLLLLWHHLFFYDPKLFEKYTTLLSVNGIPIEAMIADCCKVCVAIFLIVSGYGMSKSYSRRREKSAQKGICFDVSFIKTNLIRLYVPYWMVFVLFVPLGFLFHRNPVAIYDSNPVHLVVDFFGLSYLFHDFCAYSMNETWWYMSIIVVFYLLYPLLHRLVFRFPEITFLMVLVISFSPFQLRQYSIWLLPFVLGIYASRRNIFERISLLKANRLLLILFNVIFVFAFALLRAVKLYYSVRFDFLFGFSIIILVFLAISRVSGLSIVLEALGKQSGLIFMLHTFIFSYYFSDFVYSFKYPPLIFIILLSTSFLVSVIIHKAMSVAGLFPRTCVKT